MPFCLVLLASVGSALAAAASGVLQHRSARRAPTAAAAPRRLLAHLATRPLWLAGLLAGAAGLVLHAVALSGGRLAVVQPLLVSGVLFALPASALWERRRPSPAEGLWALVLVGALATFVVVAGRGGGQHPTGGHALVITTGAGALLCLGAGAAGMRRPGRYGAALLGTGAGLGYGLAAALLQRTTAVASHGVVALVSHWPLYALVVVGAAATVLTQLAYRAGPLATSMPVITIVDPASSVLIGVLAFGESLAHSPVELAAEILSFLVMSTAAVRLSRRGHAERPAPTQGSAAAAAPSRTTAAPTRPEPATSRPARTVRPATWTVPVPW